MRFTFIPDDGFVSIDGIGKAVDLSQISPAVYKNIHAVQWDETGGSVEYKKGPARYVMNLDFMQPIIDLYNRTG